MLLATLISGQSRPILVVAHQRILEILAPLYGVGDGGTADDQPVVLDAR